MSTANEITRLGNAKSAIAAAIANKGVTVPATTKLDGMAALIEQIEQGSSLQIARLETGSAVGGYTYYIDENGKLQKSWVPCGTPMIGGTVMELIPCDGTIEKAYHYYCKNVEFEK